MADEEGEAAFFQNQANDTETADTTAPEAAQSEGDEDEYDPSKPFDDHYEAPVDLEQDGEDTPADDSVNPDPLPDPDTGLAGDNQDLSQNPSRVESQTSTPVPQVTAQAPSQARTIGGFVDEEDEEDPEEADYEPPAALEVDDTNAIPMTISENQSSENANQNTSPEVPFHQVVQGAPMSDVANSSYSPALASNIDPSAPTPALWGSQDPSIQNNTVSTPVLDSSSTLKGRLPHDRVGILQDRIDEDPRGDIPAWLELIAEHRSRNRLDSAREVYERFLKIFPMAVS